MNVINAFGKQPKSWMLAETLVYLGGVVVLDLHTTWQFSMFVFYSTPVFFIALHFPRRMALGFAIFVGVVAMLANLDSLPRRSMGSFAWAGVNRTIAYLFVAGCAISVRNVREEMRQRMRVLEHSQELEREIIRAGEREQMRIGQDLHDGVCQTLAALDCAAQCLKLDLENAGSPQAKLAADIQKGLSAATLEARNLARGIYPVSIKGDGLGLALRELVMTTKTLTHAPIGFESDDDIAVRDSEVAMHLYRITQEALSNAMRHANATRVDVRVTRENQLLKISVADDGCGSAIPARPDGIGWRTMRYRAKLIGAEIKMETEAAGGTTVRCSIPYSV
ncbi:MAG: sensor histidine kinase [Chthoniobacter sp.]|uniref:sensor histidine kinase n=1 Tax=Chthoniobacter sp. TaxID=2510640 RepID=UPI0032AA27DC